MNAVDIVIIICFIPFLIKGITKGFVAQLTALVSIILGAWIAFVFSDILCNYIAEHIETSLLLLYIISFILIMVVVTIWLRAIGHLLTSVIKIIMLGWLDRLLGIVFSAIKALAMLCLIVVIFNSINANFHIVNEGLLNKSVLYPTLKHIAYTIFPYFKTLITI